MEKNTEKKHFYSEKVFVVNRAFPSVHEGSLEITLIDPLRAKTTEPPK